MAEPLNPPIDWATEGYGEYQPKDVGPFLASWMDIVALRRTGVEPAFEQIDAIVARNFGRYTHMDDAAALGLAP